MSAAASLRRSMTPSARVGLVMVMAVVCLAVIGPWLAPYAPDAILGRSFAPPSEDYLLGLDFVGRDVLSRFLHGGRTAILLAIAGNTVGSAIGIALGVAAAYRGGWTDEIVGRTVDLALAFPGLVLALLLLAAFGSSQLLIMVAIAVTIAPGVARIARAAALGVVSLPYVEAAKARGESAIYIAIFEIIPNILSTLLVDYGMRMTGAILLVSALGFLGLGLQPPAADWGLIVGENRLALLIQPWPVVIPVIAISLLTIGINLVIDGYRRDRTAAPEAARVG
jgi:peptide/nickel transport system permease protein